MIEAKTRGAATAQVREQKSEQEETCSEAEGERESTTSIPSLGEYLQILRHSYSASTEFAEVHQQLLKLQQDAVERPK